MKPILFALFSLYALQGWSQEPADALRYSWQAPGGTARQQAIGGAMGALGGDISATFVNPAGLGFYKTGDVVLTPRFQFGNNKATYFGRSDKQPTKKLAWGTTGFVTSIGGNAQRGKNVALSLVYNRAADFNNSILYGGSNNKSSYSQQYVDELNNSGRRDSTVTYSYPFGSSLAFNTYWIDPTYDSSGHAVGFQTKFPIGTPLLQQQQIQTRGGIDEFALGIGGSLNNKLLIGGSFTVPVLHYTRIASFREEDPTTDVTNHFNYAIVDENVTTKGVGIGGRLGLIYKPVDFVRIGLAFHTPTVYSLKDAYDVSITTDAEDAQGALTDYSRDYTNDQPAEFSYTLVTPYRVVASAAYVLREVEDVSKQKGFLTVDIEYVNYRSASFQPETESDTQGDDLDYFNRLNVAVDQAYKPAFNFRVGGELKFTTLMVRAGAAYYGNPYKNINGERGRKLNLSGGLGYRNNGFFVDLAYVQSLGRDVHFAYRLENAPYEGAQIKSGLGNVIATIGFKL